MYVSMYCMYIYITHIAHVHGTKFTFDYIEIFMLKYTKWIHFAQASYSSIKLLFESFRNYFTLSGNIS